MRVVHQVTLLAVSFALVVTRKSTRRAQALSALWASRDGLDHRNLMSLGDLANELQYAQLRQALGDAGSFDEMTTTHTC